jgi:hypothetical protein
MIIKGLARRTVMIGLLLLPGCEAARSMRDDLARLTSSQPTVQRTQPARTATTTSTNRTRPASAATTNTDTPATETAAIPDYQPTPRSSSGSSGGQSLALAGKSEKELRAMLGAPTTEEDRPPGKRWRYRDGQCTLDVQLYPDVQTKQFGTLAYEVKSDDNSDEGRRLCLAQLQSRVQSGN